jgi:hypothetical protein
MAKSKIIALTALITFAIGVGAIGNVLAGEKFKLSTVYYAVKWERINVADEEGHLVAALEAKGISRNMEGKTFGDGWIDRYVTIIDINVKTGLGSGVGYGEWADREGDKIYYKFEGKRLRGKLWASYWEEGISFWRRIDERIRSRNQELNG